MFACGRYAEYFCDEAECEVTDRRSRPMNGEIEPVRLTRKYAERIDGVDLSKHQVGDRLPLDAREARLLILTAVSVSMASSNCSRTSPKPAAAVASAVRSSGESDFVLGSAATNSRSEVPIAAATPAAVTAS